MARSVVAVSVAEHVASDPQLHDGVVRRRFDARRQADVNLD
jgi:hypothetical protein